MNLEKIHIVWRRDLKSPGSCAVQRSAPGRVGADHVTVPYWTRCCHKAGRFRVRAADIAAEGSAHRPGSARSRAARCATPRHAALQPCRAQPAARLNLSPLINSSLRITNFAVTLALLKPCEVFSSQSCEESKHFVIQRKFFAVCEELFQNQGNFLLRRSFFAACEQISSQTAK